MKNNNIAIILLTLFGIFMLLAWAGMKDAQERANAVIDERFETSVEQVKEAEEIDFSEQMTKYYRESFVGFCLEEGAHRTFCECAFDYMAERQTFAELVDSFGNGGDPDLIFDATLNCIHLY